MKTGKQSGRNQKVDHEKVGKKRRDHADRKKAETRCFENGSAFSRVKEKKRSPVRRGKTGEDRTIEERAGRSPEGRRTDPERLALYQERNVRPATVGLWRQLMIFPWFSEKPRGHSRSLKNY